MDPVKPEDIKKLGDQIKTASEEIRTKQEEMAAQIKANGEANAETKAALEQMEAKRAELGERFLKLDEILTQIQTEMKRFEDFGRPGQLKTLGALYIESEGYKSIEGKSRAVGDSSAAIERKDITNESASAGALVRPDRDPEVYRNPERPTYIRDLIAEIPTSSNSVEVMRQNVFTNAAAPQGVAESGLGAGEFEAKPESNITWELITVAVTTVAHWVPASRQVLSDAPMLRGLIDVDLSYGLRLENDAQLLFGDGTGQNVEGIMVDSDVNDVGEIATGTTAADLPGAMIDHIRSAITQCQLNEYYNMTGLVLNPQDWETLETAKATDGHYLLMQFPNTGAEAQLWRVPVVVTNAMTQGDFLIGDWIMGAKLYAREDITVRVSESHADYFVKNGVAVLAEERYAFKVTRPKAFCKGSFAVAAS